MFSTDKILYRRHRVAGWTYEWVFNHDKHSV